MRRLLVLVCLVIVTAVGGCVEMDSFLFNTETLDRYHPPETLPDSLLEHVTFESEGNTLHGYWVRSVGARSGTVVLYCHGNKHNMDEYWDRVELLHRLGVTVFTFDYRGYGLSEGTSSEAGMHADADAALATVRAGGFVADSTVLYGYSLGNVASIHLAADRIRPRALLVESAFASATALVQGGTVLDFPSRWLTDGTFDNAEALARVAVPVLVLHGMDDDFVRFRDNGQVLFDRANEPKELIAVPGAVHDDIPRMMGIESYLEEIAEMLDRR
jgi:fermentation-respiration switch protein FrsA (DUF1100 family)